MGLTGVGEIIDAIGATDRSLYIETTSILGSGLPYSSIDIFNEGDDSTTLDRMGIQTTVIRGTNSNVGYRSNLGSSTGSDIGLYVRNTSVGTGTTQKGTDIAIDSTGGSQDYTAIAHNIDIAGANSVQSYGIYGNVVGGIGAGYGSSFQIDGNSTVATGYEANIGNSTSMDKAANTAFYGYIDGSLTGSPSTNSILYGAINGVSSISIGTELLIANGSSENYGDKILLTGSIGISNYGSKITNSIADPSPYTTVNIWGQHITIDGVGEAVYTYKFGSSIYVSELSRDSYGQNISVVGASSTNTGVDIRVTNTSGWNNWGQKIRISSPASSPGAAQTIYGQEIIGTDNGNTSLTYKYGSKITLSGTGREYYGIEISVSGANSVNDALRIIAGRTRFNTGQDATSDVQILGDTDASLFVADVSADAIGVGTSTPTTKLDVRGSFQTVHNPNSPLISSGVGYGDEVTFGTSSGSLTQGKVYYLSTGLVWTLTDANAASSATGMLAVALGTAVSDGMLVRGYVRNTTLFTATDGQILYLSAATTGNVTSTAPTGASDIVRVVGYQISATNDIIYFNPSNDWVEI
jgi:hypothetical protein